MSRTSDEYVDHMRAGGWDDQRELPRAWPTPAEREEIETAREWTRIEAKVAEKGFKLVPIEQS